MNTQVIITLVEMGDLKAFVALRFANIEVQGLKILESPEGLTVVFPILLYHKDGKRYFQKVIRITDDTERQMLKAKILAEYERTKAVSKV